MPFQEAIVALLLTVLGLGNAYFSWCGYQAKVKAWRQLEVSERRQRQTAADLVAAHTEIRQLRRMHLQWVSEHRAKNATDLE